VVNPWLEQKSNNKTPLRFRSGRLFLPITPIQEDWILLTAVWFICKKQSLPFPYCNLWLHQAPGIPAEAWLQDVPWFPFSGQTYTKSLESFHLDLWIAFCLTPPLRTICHGRPCRGITPQQHSFQDNADYQILSPCWNFSIHSFIHKVKLLPANKR